jgi:hypothetical protein
MRGLKYFAVSIALLSAMAVALGQSPGMPRIGWVLNGTPENTSHLVEAIRAGLADEGLVDRKNVTLDVRFTAGRSERYGELFADLVRQPVSVLAASSHAGISAARDASGGRIPVSAFFCGNDVNQMVQSFGQPAAISRACPAKVRSCGQARRAARDAVPGCASDSCGRPEGPGKDKELAETGRLPASWG